MVAQMTNASSASLLEERVRHALAHVRNRIQGHAGDVDIVSVSPDGDVTLAMCGTCVSCPAQAMTIGTAILPVVEKVSGVRKVHINGMIVSEAALRRIRAMVA